MNILFLFETQFILKFFLKKITLIYLYIFFHLTYIEVVALSEVFYNLNNIFHQSINDKKFKINLQFFKINQ